MSENNDKNNNLTRTGSFFSESVAFKSMDESEASDVGNESRRVKSSPNISQGSGLSTLGGSENDIRSTKSADDIKAKSSRKKKHVSRLAKNRKWHDRGVIGGLKSRIKSVKKGFQSVGKTSEEKFKLQQEDFLIYTIANCLLNDNEDGAAKESWQSWCKATFVDKLNSMVDGMLNGIEIGNKPNTNDIAVAGGLNKDDPRVWWVRNVTGHVYNRHKKDLDAINDKVGEIKNQLIDFLLNKITASKVMETCEKGQGSVTIRTYSGGPSNNLILNAHFNQLLNKVQSWLKSSIGGTIKLGKLGYSFVAAALSRKLKSSIVIKFRIIRNDTVDGYALSNTLNELDKLLSAEEASILRERLLRCLKQGKRIGDNNLKELVRYVIEFSGFSPGRVDKKWGIYDKWDDLFSSSSFPLSDKEWAKALQEYWKDFDSLNKAAEANRKMAKNMVNIKTQATETTPQETSLCVNGIRYEPIDCGKLIWNFDGVDYDNKSNDPFLIRLRNNQDAFANHVGYCLKLAETPKTYYDYVNGKNGMTDENGNKAENVTTTLSVFSRGKGSGKADLNNYCKGVANLLEEDMKKYQDNVKHLLSSFELPKGVDEKSIKKSYKDLRDFALKELDNIKNTGIKQLNDNVKDKINEYFITDIKIKINKGLDWKNVFENISLGSINSDALEKEKINSNVPQLDLVLSFVEHVVNKGSNILNGLVDVVLPVVNEELLKSLVDLKSSFATSIEKGYLGKKSPFKIVDINERSNFINKCNSLLGSKLK